jgi:aquaporin Z
MALEIILCRRGEQPPLLHLPADGGCFHRAEQRIGNSCAAECRRDDERAQERRGAVHLGAHGSDELACRIAGNEEVLEVRGEIRGGQIFRGQKRRNRGHVAGACRLDRELSGGHYGRRLDCTIARHTTKVRWPTPCLVTEITLNSRSTRIDVVFRHTPMKKYIVEFIGTFFLMFTVAIAVRSNVPFAPFAIGSILMVMIFAGGHISGGHFNPAVTLAAFLRGRCDKRDVIPYWIAQFGAAVVAAVLANFILHGRVDPAQVANHPTIGSFIVEFLFTFALAWTVLNVATSKGTMGNSFYGLAIGFTVLVGAITVGGISGGAFNPAVGLGAWTLGLESPRQFGVYCISDFGGAAVAAFAYRAINGID